MNRECHQCREPLDNTAAICARCLAEIPLEPAANLTDATPAGPWRRWTARTLDMIINSLIPGILYDLFCGSGINRFAADILFTLLALLLDAAIYAIFGNTPGKRLLGVKIVDGSMRVIDRGTYFRRNLRIFCSGYALGIPIAALVTFAIQYSRVSRGNPASYDEALNLTALHCRSGKLKTLLAALLLGALILLSILLNASTRFN
ncbi:MAG: RDD family protein [Victivallaceae bacterium]